MSNKIIFISHISEEKELADLFSDCIKDGYLGLVDTFVSSDHTSISSGARWIDEITKALDNSIVQLSLCSEMSIERPWINFEAGAAWIRRIPVIPICHSGLYKKNLPIPLALLQACDIDNKEDLGKIFESLSKTIGANKVPKIDLDELINKSLEVTNNYIYYGKIRNSVYEINNIFPDIGNMLISGHPTSTCFNCPEYKKPKFMEYIENLQNFNFISISGSGTNINANGTSYDMNITILSGYEEVRKHVFAIK